MAEISKPNSNLVLPADDRREAVSGCIHPAWQKLMNYCAHIGHGEIEKLKIQDGLPMAAEVTTRKVKFSS